MIQSGPKEGALYRLVRRAHKVGDIVWDLSHNVIFRAVLGADAVAGNNRLVLEPVGDNAPNDEPLFKYVCVGDFHHVIKTRPVEECFATFVAAGRYSADTAEAKARREAHELNLEERLKQTETPKPRFVLDERGAIMDSLRNCCVMRQEHPYVDEYRRILNAGVEALAGGQKCPV